jgi:hypothetical protein
MQQVPDLDAILVPISGGGMTSGIAIAVRDVKPSIKGNISTLCQQYTRERAENVRWEKVMKLGRVPQILFPAKPSLRQRSDEVRNKNHHLLWSLMQPTIQAV